MFLTIDRNTDIGYKIKNSSYGQLVIVLVFKLERAKSQNKVYFQDQEMIGILHLNKLKDFVKKWTSIG